MDVLFVSFSDAAVYCPHILESEVSSLIYTASISGTIVDRDHLSK